MSVNILNKEIKKAYSSQLTLCPFHHKRSRELSSKKNKKITLVNVLNKKIKKKRKEKQFTSPWLTLCPFHLERYREPEHSTKKCKDGLDEIFPLF